jgi:hypothetical protein
LQVQEHGQELQPRETQLTVRTVHLVDGCLQVVGDEPLLDVGKRLNAIREPAGAFGDEVVADAQVRRAVQEGLVDAA